MKLSVRVDALEFSDLDLEVFHQVIVGCIHDVFFPGVNLVYQPLHLING
jgi:hypothetical protein